MSCEHEIFTYHNYNICKKCCKTFPVYSPIRYTNYEKVCHCVDSIIVKNKDGLNTCTSCGSVNVDLFINYECDDYRYYYSRVSEFKKQISKYNIRHEECLVSLFKKKQKTIYKCLGKRKSCPCFRFILMKLL